MDNVLASFQSVKSSRIVFYCGDMPIASLFCDKRVSVARNYEWNCVYIYIWNFVHLTRSAHLLELNAPQCGSQTMTTMPLQTCSFCQISPKKNDNNGPAQTSKKKGKKHIFQMGGTQKKTYQQVAAQFLRLLVFSDAKLGGPLSVMSGSLRFSRKSSTVSTFCEAGFPQSKPRIRAIFFS